MRYTWKLIFNLKLKCVWLWRILGVQPFSDCVNSGIHVALRLREFHYSDVEVNEFVNLTKICISQTTFVFNDKYYKQSEGLRMGNP